MRRVPTLIGGVALALVVVAGCAGTDGRELADPGPTTTDPFAEEIVDDGDPLTLSAPGVDDDGSLDPRHTCRGEDVSPELSWSGGPEDVASWAVVAEDEAGAVRWIVVNLSPETRFMAAGETDPLAVIGENSDGRVGWAGPCPDPGESADWTVTVFAVSQVLEALPGDPADALFTAVASAAIESGGIGISVAG